VGEIDLSFFGQWVEQLNTQEWNNNWFAALYRAKITLCQGAANPGFFFGEHRRCNFLPIQQD